MTDKRKIILTVFIFCLSGIIYSDEPLLSNFRINGANLEPSHEVAFNIRGKDFLFTMNPDNNSLIDFYYNRFTSSWGSRYLQEIIDRGNIYRDFIASRIEYYELPPELEFLPVLESEYKVNAVSVSGALGLWQFMTNSISPYEMKIDKWRDDRRDFWKSTDGALRKLAYNYSVLNDWLLALAAYNCGLGCVQRAISSSGLNDYWLLSEKGYLPQQTVHYVPKFIAIVAASKQNTFIQNPDWSEQKKWDRIPLTGQLSLKILAETSGVPINILQTGNSELNYGVTPPGEETYFLKVPAEYTDAVKRSLTQENKMLMEFTVHTVHTGDTLSQIARHYNVGMSLILHYNPSIRPEFLMVGDEIIVPDINNSGPLTAESTFAEIPDFPGTHRISKGETLWAIARLYGTTPEIIAAKNNIKLSDPLSVGLELKVPLILPEEVFTE